MKTLASAVRNGVAALALLGAAALPAHAQLPNMAIPGMPGIPGMEMFTPIALTDDLVLNFIAGYATITPALEAVSERYNVPAGDDPAAAMAALGALNQAMAEMDGIVTPFGFTGFSQYSQVMIAVMGAQAFADPTLTEQERTMMRQFMPPFMLPTDENVAVVAPHFAEIQTLIDAE
jgi:hypothetical protein